MSASATSSPGKLDARRVGLAGEPAAGDVDDQRFDGDAGHALGGVDGEADRLLGGVEIGDDPRLDAARALMADAEHLDRMGAAAAAPRPADRSWLQPRDQAADLGRADVEDRDDRAVAAGRAASGRRSRTASRVGLCLLRQLLALLEHGWRAPSCPSSVSRTTIRSVRRRSTAAMSRESSPLPSSSSATSATRAASGSASGSMHLDAVVERDVPAPVGDQDAGAHARA